MKKGISHPSSLLLVQGKANPSNTDQEQFFLLQGDATRDPIKLGIPEDVNFPEKRELDTHPFHLKIFHFNDLHSHFSNIEHDGNKPIFSKMVSYIKQAQSLHREDPNSDVIAFSGGDDMIGSPFDVLAGIDLKSYQIHTGYYLSSQVGLTAAVIGNHEFDLGLDLLAHSIRKEAVFPIISANLRPTCQLEKLVYPASIFIRKGIRIGIIGLTTPAESRARQGSEYEIVDPLPVAKRLLPIVRSLSDIVIIISHLGFSLCSTTAAVSLAGDIELAQSLPHGGVDLIIGGHTHDILNQNGLDPKNVVNGIPITQAGCNGNYLGEVDLILENSSKTLSAKIIPTELLPADDEFENKFVQPLIKQMRPQLGKKLGIVADHQDLRKGGEKDVLSANIFPLQNFVTDGLVACCRKHGLFVDFAAIDRSVINDNLHPGQELTYGDWIRVMPFANTLMLFTITGKELIDLIKDNALRIDFPDEPREERGFIQFSKEISYRIKVSSIRSGIQAVDIRFNGIPLEENLDRKFRVASTNFFRVLAHKWEQQNINQMPLIVFYPEHADGQDTGIFVREFLIEHILEFGGINSFGGAVRDDRIAEIA